MKTEDFDNGSFWLMVDAPAVMNRLALCGYSLVGVMYSVVLVRTLGLKNGVSLGPQSTHKGFFESSLSKFRVANAASHRFGKVAAFFKTNDQYVRVWIKIADLTVETLILCVILEDGSPIGLVVSFTAIVAMNAFSCAVMMFLPDSYAGLTEVIVDITFDFLFAVAFPMLTVIYCLSSFRLDYAKLSINMEIFPLGAFEREASVIANPVQTDIIYKTLKALIDGDIAPKSYAEWMAPVDVTAKVVQLASTGDLRTVKLTNRYLPVLPEELRLCREMQYMSLMYTSTERIPVWAKEFVHLEYLYIEGASNSSLLELPDDMFKDMSSLTFIHLGTHPQLQQLPSFEGLDNLKTLVLAVLVSLVELPSFDSLYNLERMELTTLPTITTLPDFKSLQKLKTFI
ncbi:hypothetical protein PF008_g9268 [Phytophthora fragariae]|uniref:Uncharacterized protein n=1 Tax=Phytophthora fragariae TaxID=53985 RepID=A0A6G0RYT9_9STRA|nr:hypothetical protein PF008_g9268 [Phytophthora fragariae]